MDKVMHPKMTSKKGEVAKAPKTGKIESYTPSMNTIQAYNRKGSKQK